MAPPPWTVDAERRERTEGRGPHVSQPSKAYLHIQDVFDITVAVVALVRNLVAADKQFLLVCQLLLVELHDNGVDEHRQIVNRLLLVCLNDESTMRNTINCFSALMAAFRRAIFLSLSETAAYDQRSTLHQPKDR